jgi:hypothetical protein
VQIRSGRAALERIAGGGTGSRYNKAAVDLAGRRTIALLKREPHADA